MLGRSGGRGLDCTPCHGKTRPVSQLSLPVITFHNTEINFPSKLTDDTVLFLLPRPLWGSSLCLTDLLATPELALLVLELELATLLFSEEIFVVTALRRRVNS